MNRTSTTWADVAMAMITNAVPIATALGVLLTTISSIVSMIFGIKNHVKIEQAKELVDKGNELTAKSNELTELVNKQTDGLVKQLVASVKSDGISQGHRETTKQ
ncbi:MAG TPA: hypothetical protein VGF75_07810 [Candidatus Saccharimonadales bacterium]|jgi:hypothetical protein